MGNVIRRKHISQVPVRSIAVTSDDKTVIAACQDRNTVILNMDNEIKEVHRSEFHNDIQLRVVLSPNEKTFVTTSADSTAKIWSMENFQLLHALSDPDQKKWIWDAAYTKDSACVVTGGTDKSIRLWNVNDGHLYRDHVLGIHNKGITALTILNI